MKLVSNTLNEFEKGRDPRSAMDIGVSHEWKEKILNDSAFRYGGMELHKYINEIIDEGPEYEKLMMETLKSLHYEGWDRIINVISYVPKAFVWYWKNEKNSLIN